MLAYALFLLILVERSSCSCPSGFELVKDGECRGLQGTYSINAYEATVKATSFCKSVDGLPIIIHNDEHQSYWMSKVKEEYTTIGIMCSTKTNRWMWADGTPIDYKPSKYYAGLDNSCGNDVNWIMKSDGFWTYWTDNQKLWSADIFCTTQLTPPTPSPDGCDSFEDDSEDGVCYQIGATAENWQEAQIICRSFGATPASIHSAKENSFIRRLAVSNGKVNGLYLGATISGKGNDYAWVDGSEWDYDNFYPGFPMSGLGDCLILDTESAAGQWANVDCSSKLSVACERQQHYTPPTCSAGPWVEGQIIYSPGFPFNSSTPCDYVLEVDAGKRVEVEILLLEANNCCDQLVIFENYFGGTVVANLTGEVNDKKYTTASSNFMRVSWRPNGGVNVRGMLMTYRGV